MIIGIMLRIVHKNCFDRVARAEHKLTSETKSLEIYGTKIQTDKS